MIRARPRSDGPLGQTIANSEWLHRLDWAMGAGIAADGKAEAAPAPAMPWRAGLAAMGTTEGLRRSESHVDEGDAPGALPQRSAEAQSREA